MTSAPAPLIDDAIDAVIAWYEQHHRDLPWRSPAATPWAILVSEIMLQQTPVARVIIPWTRWMERWPTPTDLAAAETADVLRAWDRLGYPRRALRLQDCARAITAQHDGEVPDTLEELRALPGIGEYTAAAIMSFAHRRRAVVVDTNVRRVLVRAVSGQALPAPSYTSAERRLATETVPEDEQRAVAWNQAVMELGALVCTARTARCQECPLSEGWCSWQAQDCPPAAEGMPRRIQPFEGTDRQMRGMIMARLRAQDAVAIQTLLDLDPGDADRVRRCVASLCDDGLARRDGELLRLP